MREHKTIRALRRGEVVELEGLKFRMAVDEDGKEEAVKEGDLFIAERNTGPHLLTAEEIVSDTGPPRFFGGWINAVEPCYAFDIPECVKVVWIEED